MNVLQPFTATLTGGGTSGWNSTPAYISILQLTSNKDGLIGLCSVLRPRQHSIGYMGDVFYRSKDPTNSIKVLKEDLQKNKANNENN